MLPASFAKVHTMEHFRYSKYNSLRQSPVVVFAFALTAAQSHTHCKAQTKLCNTLAVSLSTWFATIDWHSISQLCCCLLMNIKLKSQHGCLLQSVCSQQVYTREYYTYPIYPISPFSQNVQLSQHSGFLSALCSTVPNIQSQKLTRNEKHCFKR